MSGLMELFEDVAPWLVTAITGGPVGLATMAAGKIASALGLSESTLSSVTSSLTSSALTPEQKVALTSADNEFKLKMQELGFQSEKDMVVAETAMLQAVNATMQMELQNSQNEAWYQKSWRPANGFCVALGSFAGVIATCLLFWKAITNKDPSAINAIPQLATSLSLILAVPGAAVGIAAWHRGKEQRGK